MLSFAPSANGVFDYGSVTVGQTLSQTFTLTNSGGAASGTLTLELSGSTAFTLATDSCTGRSIGPGKSCRIAVQYGPTAAGQLSATLAGSGEQPVVSASLTLIGTGARAGHVYWANTGTNAIGRADLDGNPASVNQSFIGGGSNVAGIAVDSSHIYWANRLANTIGRADLDGNPASVDQSFISGASSPVGVAVDSGHIYWTECRFRQNRSRRSGWEPGEREPGLHCRTVLPPQSGRRLGPHLLGERLPWDDRKGGSGWEPGLRERDLH